MELISAEIQRRGGLSRRRWLPSGITFWIGPGQALSQKDLFLENLRSLRGIRPKLIFITGDLFPSLEFMKTGTDAQPFPPCCTIRTDSEILWVINLFGLNISEVIKIYFFLKNL
jgi:hypothetical protein